MIASHSCMKLFLASAMLLSTAGCFGSLISAPQECSFDLPVPFYKFTMKEWGPDKNVDKLYLPEKKRFLELWGKPDEIITISDEKEVYVYNRKIVCGVTLAYLLPIPLVSENCDGFDHITFKGNVATHIHFKRSNSYGAIFPIMSEVKKTCP